MTIPNVLSAAVRFFSRRGGVYSAFVESQGPTHVALRGQGNEEIVIGAYAVPGGSRVTGASYLFDQQIAQFLASLPPAAAVEPEPEPVADAAAAGAVA